MRVSYYNIGCKVNFAETSQLQEDIEKLGYETVDFKEPADFVIINTCTVTSQADSDCRKIIRRALKFSPNAKIIVTGCYVQLNPDDIKSIDGVTAILGNKEKFDIPNIINNLNSENNPSLFITDNRNIPFHNACSIDNESHTRIVMKIQDGCDYFCSYCAVAYARGKSNSMDFNELKRKILKHADSDYYEIVLSGINLGEYKAPTGENLYSVLDFIEKSNIKQRIRISSIEPNLLTEEIINLVADSNKICPHFHIPLQSGSDKILKLMRRRYDTEYFINLINKIIKKIPDCCIGIDVISGFPGETDEDFKKTYSLLQNIPVSYLHPFTYSERKITQASNFPNKVNNIEKKARTKQLKELSEQKKTQFYNSQLGKIKTVIPEDYNKEEGYWKGWTENYVRVHFKADKKLEKIPVKVILEDIENGIVGGRIVL